LIEKYKKHAGTKLSKQRLFVLLAENLTGEKLTPLVIGKTAKPHCFKNQKIPNLSII